MRQIATTRPDDPVPHATLFRRNVRSDLTQACDVVLDVIMREIVLSQFPPGIGTEPRVQLEQPGDRCACFVLAPS